MNNYQTEKMKKKKDTHGHGKLKGSTGLSMLGGDSQRSRRRAAGAAQRSVRLVVRLGSQISAIHDDADRDVSHSSRPARRCTVLSVLRGSWVAAR